MTSKESYEKLPLGFQFGSGYRLDFALFDAGWKAALDEAAKACRELGDNDAHLLGFIDAKECIKAIGELK